MRYRLIDLLRGTRIISRYNHFKKTRYTVESLRRLQRRKLCELLLSIRRSNPYFTLFLKDWRESDIQADPERVLKSLPMMDKSLIAANRDTLFHPLPGRRYMAKHTGGSTGEPFHYHVDLSAISEFSAFHLWSWHRFANYRPGDPFLAVAGGSFEAAGHPFKIAVYRFLQNNYQISGDIISERMQVDRKKIRKAILLFGYPSSILALLETNPTLLEGHRLRAVFTTSEQLLPHVRTFIESRLGVPVFDSYGALDGGIISYECTEHKGLHYDPLNCYVETWQNETGQSELLLTGLNSLCLPMVRYRVGDAAILGDFGSCSCGDPFPMIQNLLGRTRDLIRLKNGRAIHGSKFNKVMYGFPAVRRYRIIQEEDYRVGVQVDVADFETWARSPQKKFLETQIGNILVDTDFEINAMIAAHTGNAKFKVVESRVA